MNRPFSFEQILISFEKILPFLGVTFEVMLGTIILGLLLSILIVRQNYSKKKIWNRLSKGYVHILRCTPSIVLLFIVFYGIPKLIYVLTGANINFWPKIVFVVIALSLLYSAQLAEIIRSSLESVGKGQYEAAISLGISPFRAMTRIVIPQALVAALPNLGNSFISLLKEGSLAYTIGLIDVMGKGNLIISLNYGGYALETYIALAIIYWAVTLIIEFTFKLLEKRFSKGRINAA
ncbi:MAG: amino acid ABC transporter permease [Treponema sp.]|nr:amino acid ABC transporter permease [Treponema sp.]